MSILALPAKTLTYQLTVSHFHLGYGQGYNSKIETNYLIYISNAYLMYASLFLELSPLVTASLRTSASRPLEKLDARKIKAT